MIKVTVRYGDRCADIRFPCKDSELQAKLDTIRRHDTEDMELFVSAVHFPEELKVLEDRFVDLDELNYLGRRLDGFFGDEHPRFAEAVKLEGATTVREMINIACDVYRYALITDVSDPAKVGAEYVLQTEGSVPADYKSDPKYAAIGKELMQSGRGVFTDQGILFVNTERPLEQQYTGSTFPSYLDDPNCLMITEISHQGQSAYVNLPCERLTLEKALHRLGAADAADCQISLDYFSTESSFQDLCIRTLETEGIFALNHWCEAVCNYVKPENHMAFVAAFTASGMNSTLDAVKVAENIDSFYYAKGVKNEADLGRWWLEHYSQFTISPELQQFFDYKEYGEYLSQFLDVHYLESGDCIFLDGTTMDEVLGIAPAEDVGMGGLQ